MRPPIWQVILCSLGLIGFIVSLALGIGFVTL